MEHRATADLAGQADGSIVHFHDSFGDGQAHARPLDRQSLRATAVKLFEDHCLIEVVYARSVIGHAGDELRFAELDGDMDGSTRRRVLAGILQQLYKHLRNTGQVHARRRKAFGNVHFHVMLLQCVSVCCSAASTASRIWCGSNRNSTWWASRCATSDASPTSRLSRSLSSLMMVASSLSCGLSNSTSDRRVSAEALMEVKGVRNSWVTESSSRERSRSPSRLASALVSFCMVL